MRESEPSTRAAPGAAGGPANGHRPKVTVDSEPAAEGTVGDTEETPPACVVAIQIGDINIVNNYCGQSPLSRVTMEVEDTMERMETAVDGTTLEGAPKLISMSQASKKSGINRQTIHRALPRIKHVRWEPESGHTLVLLYEDAWEEYLRTFRPRKKTGTDP
jgi:hypothetical protein